MDDKDLDAKAPGSLGGRAAKGSSGPEAALSWNSVSLPVHQLIFISIIFLSAVQSFTDPLELFDDL